MLWNRLGDPTVVELSQRAARDSSRGNVESPIGVLIGLSTEARINGAAGARCGPRIGAAVTAAPLRDAQARAVPACALIPPTDKGRTAWSALILLNAARAQLVRGIFSWHDPGCQL